MKKFKPTGGNSRFQRKTVRACQNAPFDGGHYGESNSMMLFMDINETLGLFWLNYSHLLEMNSTENMLISQQSFLPAAAVTFKSPQFIHFMTLFVLFLPHYVGKGSLSVNYFGFSVRVYMRQGIKAGATDVASRKLGTAPELSARSGLDSFPVHI